jgi:hypothetical protein
MPRVRLETPCAVCAHPYHQHRRPLGRFGKPRGAYICIHPDCASQVGADRCRYSGRFRTAQTPAPTSTS